MEKKNWVGLISKGGVGPKDGHTAGSSSSGKRTASAINPIANPENII